MEDTSKNFIENFIDEDIAEGGQFAGMGVVQEGAIRFKCMLLR